MVFASMRSTVIFLRAPAEIKKIASLRATQKFGEHEQASTRLNFAANRAKVKFYEQLKIFMDHSSPLYIFRLEIVLKGRVYLQLYLA